MAKHKLYRLPNGTAAYLEMNSTARILRDKGVEIGGDVQTFHTANVLRRIQKYMPYQSGMTIKVTIAQTDVKKPRIVTNVPYGKYLYYGKVMKGRAPRVATQKDLHYTRIKNPLAGPYWDRALVAAEGAALRAEVQSFIDRKKGAHD